jgi:hypothetical protein
MCKRTFVCLWLNLSWAEGGEEARASAAGEAAGATSARASSTEGVDGAFGGHNSHPFDQIFHRAFSQISAEAFITDFVRQAIEAHRFRGNPPASKFAIDHLKESTTIEESTEACTVCQDLVEQGAVTLSMPCGHLFHKDCLMPWLQEHNTCPVCRCEIESHCARYNQQNFGKLKGELGTETVRCRAILLPCPSCRASGLATELLLLTTQVRPCLMMADQGAKDWRGARATGAAARGAWARGCAVISLGWSGRRADDARRRSTFCENDGSHAGRGALCPHGALFERSVK